MHVTLLGCTVTYWGKTTHLFLFKRHEKHRSNKEHFSLHVLSTVLITKPKFEANFSFGSFLMVQIEQRTAKRYTRTILDINHLISTSKN